ncbi:MAG: hypothetical protein NXI01_09265 [Gammaproteobacteria bacterium]|nr:hypothetical protein [Gammaproteobacteria bacterium]
MFFTTDDLADGILNLYGKNAINKALQLLEELQVISVHKNPNPRYHFDKTKYFIFYPETCNEWIKKDQEKTGNQNSSIEGPKESIDHLKASDRSSQSNAPSIESKRPPLKKGQAITDTTNNTTNKDQSIKNIHGDGCIGFSQKTSPEIEEIIELLIFEGFPRKRFSYSGSIESIQKACAAGANIDMFYEAYCKAQSVTGEQGFGLNYLIKTVESLMSKKAHQRSRDGYAPKAFKSNPTLEDVYSANKGAIAPDGSKFDPYAIEGECVEGTAVLDLDQDGTNLRAFVYDQTWDKC